MNKKCGEVLIFLEHGKVECGGPRATTIKSGFVIQFGHSKKIYIYNNNKNNNICLFIISGYISHLRMCIVYLFKENCNLSYFYSPNPNVLGTTIFLQKDKVGGRLPNH